MFASLSEASDDIESMATDGDLHEAGAVPDEAPGAHPQAVRVSAGAPGRIVRRRVSVRAGVDVPYDGRGKAARAAGAVRNGDAVAGLSRDVRRRGRGDDRRRSALAARTRPSRLHRAGILAGRAVRVSRTSHPPRHGSAIARAHRRPCPSDEGVRREEAAQDLACRDRLDAARRSRACRGHDQPARTRSTQAHRGSGALARQEGRGHRARGSWPNRVSRRRWTSSGATRSKRPAR